MSKEAFCLWQDLYKEAQMPHPEELLSQAGHLQENTDRQFRWRRLIWKESFGGRRLYSEARHKTEQ